MRMANVCYTSASAVMAPVAQMDRATGFEAEDNHLLILRIVIFLSISFRRVADRCVLWRRLPTSVAKRGKGRFRRGQRLERRVREYPNLNSRVLPFEVRA
jgi:hypothetical protein